MLMEILLIPPYVFELLYILSLIVLLRGLFLIWKETERSLINKIVWTILVVLFNVFALIPLEYSRSQNRRKGK